MNLNRLNAIAYKVLCIAASVFLVILVVGMLTIHEYLRSAEGLAFAVIIAFRTKKPASVKVWVITIVLIAIGLLLIDLDPVEVAQNKHTVMVID
jgi:hypothetical protein